MPTFMGATTSETRERLRLCHCTPARTTRPLTLEVPAAPPYNISYEGRVGARPHTIPKVRAIMTTATKSRSDVKDLKLAPHGKKRILWADTDMPVLARIRERFAKEKPLNGLRMSACLHVTAETANLARALKAGGADLVLIASNPLSTQDDVAASLVKDFGFSVYAIHGENTDVYYKHIVAALEHQPNITLDDGADLVSSMVFIALDRLDDVHQQVRQWAAKFSPAERKTRFNSVIGSMEETTTGVIRLRA